MKVVMTVTLDVDPQAWSEEFQTGPTHREVRADVTSSVTHAIHALYGRDGSLPASGCIQSVQIRHSRSVR